MSELERDTRADAIIAESQRLLTVLAPKDTEEAISQLFLMYSQISVSLKEERSKRVALESLLFALFQDYCVRFAGALPGMTMNFEIMENLLNVKKVTP